MASAAMVTPWTVTATAAVADVAMAALADVAVVVQLADVAVVEGADARPHAV